MIGLPVKLNGRVVKEMLHTGVSDYQMEGFEWMIMTGCLTALLR